MTTRAKLFAITAIALAVAAAPSAARADTPPADPAYPALQPAAIRIDHNAAAMAAACRGGAVLDDPKTPCHDYAFCKDPLTTKDIPTADEFKLIASGQCPVSTPAAW